MLSGEGNYRVISSKASDTQCDFEARLRADILTVLPITLSKCANVATEPPSLGFPSEALISVAVASRMNHHIGRVNYFYWPTRNRRGWPISSLLT